MRARFASFSTRGVRRYAPTDRWLARFSLLFAVLHLVAPVARANDQTPSVKDPLANVRVQLTRYDLEPQGTLALLPQLAALAKSLRGTPLASEAAFLRAAAANDLLYLAEFLGRDALRTGLATEFGVAPDALAPAIAAELRACAQGVYREPAIAALASLERKELAEQVPVGTPDLRRDARFVHAAAALAKDDTVGARYAALIADPCSESACAAQYADFDVEARRAFAYLQQLSAAAVRLERARGLGDPLFEVLAPELDRDIASLRALVVRLAPRVPGDRRLLTPSSLPAWPAPHVIVFAKATELTYARSPQVRIGTNGDVVRVEYAASPLSTSSGTLAAPVPNPPPSPATLAASDNAPAKPAAAEPIAQPAPPALATTATEGSKAAPVAVTAAPAKSVAGAPNTQTVAPTVAVTAAPAKSVATAPSTQPVVPTVAVAANESAQRVATAPSAQPVAPTVAVAANESAKTPLVPNTQPVAPAVATIPTQGSKVASAASASPRAPVPVFPAMTSIKYDPNDTALATRSIDDLVAAIRGIRGDEPAFRAWLVADAGITAQLPARALVSLRKAGAKDLFFAATTKDGALVASPIRLVIATVDSAAENPDLKLRVRLGGYSLDIGRGVTDIPRIRDESGWQFDVAALHTQVRARPPRTAAVSFMTDVAVDQLLRALHEVAPSRAPLDLVIQ